MTDYKRMVSYMYQYENGVKKKNVGFARIESKEGQCKITLHMQLLGQLDSIFPTYLIQRKNEGIELIYLGDTMLKNQVMDSKLIAEEGNIMNSGYGLSDMGGLLLFLNDGVFFATEWDDKPIIEAEVLEALKPKPKEENKLSLAEELLIPKYKLPRGYKIIERLQTAEAFASHATIDYVKLAYDTDKKLQEKSLQERTQTELAKAAQLKSEVRVEPEQSQEGPEAAVDATKIMEEESEEQVTKDQRAEEQGTVVQRTEEQLINEQMTQEQTRVNKTTEEPTIKEQTIEEQTTDHRAIKELTREEETRSEEQMTKDQSTENQASYGQLNSEGIETVQAIYDQLQQLQPEWEQLRASNSTDQQKQAAAEFEQSEINDPQAAANIFDKFPRIYPFEDNEILLCAKIEPKDIGMLPKELWVLSNNSFLVHGYYCYHHLIFAKLKDRYGCRYILGVPGIYHNRERFMARMFGFDGFKPIRKRELRQGDFGYWYMPVRF